MSTKDKGVKVRALRPHTWRGEEKAEGDTYVVLGDESQTTEQYVDTLRGSRLALPADEEGPNVVQEVSGVDENPNATHPAGTNVAPLTTESFQQPADAEPAKPAAGKRSRAGKTATSTAPKAKAPKAAKAPRAGAKQK